MNAIALPRMTMPDLMAEEVESVLLRAGSQLDYQHGYRHVGQLDLLKALNELQMLPFETAAVVEYKKALLATNRWKLPWNRSRWYMELLRHYDAPVPKDVLTKAMQLKEKISGYTFAVEYFSRERRFYDGDPFLVVRNEGELYYIAVWDEPGFNVKPR